MLKEESKDAATKVWVDLGRGCECAMLAVGWTEPLVDAVETGTAATTAESKARQEGLGFGNGRGELSNWIDTNSNEYSLSHRFQGISPGTILSCWHLEAAVFISAPERSLWSKTGHSCWNILATPNVESFVRKHTNRLWGFFWPGHVMMLSRLKQHEEGKEA